MGSRIIFVNHKCTFFQVDEIRSNTLEIPLPQRNYFLLVLPVTVIHHDTGSAV